MTTDNGKTITRENFGGKLLVLNFWATWCPPCIEETPSLDAFARSCAEGVVVLGVSIDRNENLYRKFISSAMTSPLRPRVIQTRTSRPAMARSRFRKPTSSTGTGKVLEKVISNQNWMDPEFLARVQKML